LLDAFRQGLEARGYNEGQNLTTDYRWEALPSPALAAELVGLRPDVIVAWATPAVTTANDKHRSDRHGRDRRSGCDGILHKSVATRGSITGTTNLARDLGGKTLGLIEITPALKSINIRRFSSTTLRPLPTISTAKSPLSKFRTIPS